MRHAFTMMLCLVVSQTCYVTRCAAADAAPNRQQQALADAETLVAVALREDLQTTLRRYFESLGLGIPDLDTNAQVRLVKVPERNAPPAPLSAHIRTTITPTTPLPEQVYRESRQALVRRLHELGYLIQNPDHQAPATTPSSDAAPLASLHIEFMPPSQAQSLGDRLRLGPVLFVATTSLAALLCAILCLFMLRRLWRILRTPAHLLGSNGALTQQTETTSRDAIREPLVDGDEAVLNAHRNAISAHPQTPQAGENGAHQQDKMGAPLPPLPSHHTVHITVGEPDLPPFPATLTEFEKLPFETAVRSLATVDENMRKRIFDRLGLNKSLRQRIEQEITQS